MFAWRIARAPYADLAGVGASISPGRWSSIGHPVVYTAEAPALAVLEVRVHLDLTPEFLPTDYELLKIDLGQAAIQEIVHLPADPRAAGSDWLKNLNTPVLKVPSFIIPEHSNFLINPLHPDATRISIVDRRPFKFDERLWLPLSMPMRPPTG